MIICKLCHNNYIKKTKQECVFMDHGPNFGLTICEMCKTRKGCAECEKCNPNPEPMEGVLPVPAEPEIVAPAPTVEIPKETMQMGVIGEPPKKKSKTTYTNPTGYNGSGLPHSYEYNYKDHQIKCLKGIGMKVKCKNAKGAGSNLVEGRVYTVLAKVFAAETMNGYIQTPCYLLDTKDYRGEGTPFHFDYPYFWNCDRFEMVSWTSTGNKENLDPPDVITANGTEYRKTSISINEEMMDCVGA